MPEQFANRLDSFVIAEDGCVTPYAEMIAALEAKAAEMRAFVAKFESEAALPTAGS